MAYVIPFVQDTGGGSYFITQRRAYRDCGHGRLSLSTDSAKCALGLDNFGGYIEGLILIFNIQNNDGEYFCGCVRFSVYKNPYNNFCQVSFSSQNNQNRRWLGFCHWRSYTATRPPSWFQGEGIEGTKGKPGERENS